MEMLFNTIDQLLALTQANNLRISDVMIARESQVREQDQATIYQQMWSLEKHLGSKAPIMWLL